MRFFLFTLSLLLPLSVLASLKINTSNDKLPYEMKLLFDSYPEYQYTQKEFENAAIIVERMSASVEKIKEKDFFILVKSEIYKHFLDYKLPAPHKDTIIRYSQIDQFKKAWNKKASEFPVIFQWLAKAITSDLDSLNQVNFLKDLLKRKDSTPRSKSERSAYRELKYISPWISYLTEVEAKELRPQTKTMLLHLLKKISNLLSALAMVSPETNPKAPNFTTSIPKEKKEEKKTAKKKDILKVLKNESASDEIDMLMENIQKKQLDNEGWKPKEK